MELTWRNVAIIDLIICTNWRYWKIAEKTRRKSNRVKYKTVMLHWKGLYLLWLSIGRIDEPFQSCKIVTITGNISSLQIPLFFYSYIYDMQIRLLVYRKSSPDRALPLFLYFLVRWRETINWFQKMHHILPANPPRGLNAHRYTMINLDLRKQLKLFWIKLLPRSIFMHKKMSKNSSLTITILWSRLLHSLITTMTSLRISGNQQTCMFYYLQEKANIQK